jgi:predicted oxidoreductase (fatty acid repression mutant protein)
MTYQDTINKRRSIYALNDQLPISEDETVEVIEDAIVASPSTFNVQSAHAIILLGAQHKALWDNIVTSTLKAIVPAEAFAPTAQKLAGFSAAAGTVLYFEDDAAIASMKEQFPSYASHFDEWSAHGQGIAQVNVWNELAEKGIGANLQHYNPIIDDAVKARWNVPESYRLVAQLVFGGIAAPADEQQRQPADKRVRVVR